MRRIAAAFALVLVLSLTGVSEASVIIDVSQVGSDVVIQTQAGGSLDLTGLQFRGIAVTGASQFRALDGIFQVATAGSTVAFDAYDGITAVQSYGPGRTRIRASTANGDSFLGSAFGIVPGADAGSPQANVLLLSNGYVSGSSLAFTLTLANRTISSIGFTPGTYVNYLPNDTATINILSPVPEPGTLTGVGLGIACLAGAVIKRRREGASA